MTVVEKEGSLSRFRMSSVTETRNSAEQNDLYRNATTHLASNFNRKTLRKHIADTYDTIEQQQGRVPSR